MARVSLCGTGPASSTGSPITLMMRPSVPAPTGTVIGLSLSDNSWPRTRPSLVSMAMVRTVDSPRCWATSSTRRLPWFLVSSALRIAGRWSSNCTSTTAPMTWVMRPTLLAIMSSSQIGSQRQCLLQSFRAGDDLDQFLGDHRLAGAVVFERLLADHLAGVARGVVHRRHLRAVERRRVLDERAENLHRKIARQKLLEDILLVGLELVDRATQSCRGIGLEHRRKDLLRGRDLCDHRAEARVEQRADVEFELVEQRNDLPSDHFGVLEPQGAHRAQVDQFDDLLGVEPAQLIVTLAADAEEFDLFALGDKRVGALAGEPHDRGVERAAQAAFGGADQQQMLLIAAGATQQPRRGVETCDRRGDIAEHRVHVAGIGPRRLGRGLGAAQF